jgi:hypothetical protein
MKKKTQYQQFCGFVFKDLMTVAINQDYKVPKRVMNAIDTVANYVGDISFGRIKPKP